MNNLLLSKIIKAGAIVGTLDILTALIYFFIKTGNNPLSVLKFVASGVFGNDAFSSGNMMILMGLIFHYVIAFAFTIFFFWLFPKVKFLSANIILTGIVYGIFVWSIMNLVVVPMSNVPYLPFNAVNALINLVILIICIGVPLSFMANKFYNKAS